MFNVTALYSPKHFLLKALSNLLDLCLADSRILYFLTGPGIYPQIYRIAPCLHCLFVRGSNKQQRRVRLFEISQMDRLFNLLWQPSALGDNLTMRPFSCTSPLQFGQEENIPRQPFDRRAYWFALKIARMLPIPTGRVGVGWWKHL